MKKQLLLEKLKAPFTPEITSMARHLERKDPVFDRLYNSRPQTSSTNRNPQVVFTEDSAQDFLETKDLVSEKNGKGWNPPDNTKHPMTRAEAISKAIPNSKVEVTGAFFDRHLKWQQKKDDFLEEEREKKAQGELEGCTFEPAINSYAATPSDLAGLESATDYKMVFNGKTFDLSSDNDLQDFFLHSIDKSGQRSIFRKNYDKLNKIYSVMLK